MLLEQCTSIAKKKDKERVQNFSASGLLPALAFASSFKTHFFLFRTDSLVEFIALSIFVFFSVHRFVVAIYFRKSCGSIAGAGGSKLSTDFG
jgi:hypothetical protein